MFPMKPLRFVVSAAVCAAALVGCAGYSPLYAPIDEELTDIYVGRVAMETVETNVGERRVAQMVGQMLRQQLRGASGSPYRLDVEIKETRSTLALRRDATEQRLQVVLESRIKLLSGADTELSTSVSAISAYNVLPSPFGTESGKEQAREEAARELADKIIRRVALFLNQNGKVQAE